MTAHHHPSYTFRYWPYITGQAFIDHNYVYVYYYYNCTHPARFLLSIVEVSKVTVRLRVFLKRDMIRQTSAVIMLMNE